MSTRSQATKLKQYERGDKKLVFVVPKEEGFNSSQLAIYTLPHPKTGNRVKFIINDNKLYEIKCMEHEEHRSWFIGNYVVQDGKLYLVSPFDPLFLLLPILDRVRFEGKTSDNSEGVFKQWEDIVESMELLAGFNSAITKICNIKEVDIGLENKVIFYRLNESKVKEWIQNKFKKLYDYIKLSEPDTESDKNTLKAFQILSDYTPLKWLNELSLEHKIEQIELKYSKREVMITELSVPDAEFANISIEEKKVKKTITTKSKAQPPKGQPGILSFFNNIKK
ncbi:hypothetical protein K502DRAFT_368804 [Neoconidiobolus thromboides FSU 785]|nr:hypothetical protein K502DRAFT_368804 [Neoconidiobolus thromboides FSU 785]